MKHFGDITQIHGYNLPIVDVITGGSPCQDLSVAGKRAGLDGERSGLFMDQMRIVKEMREHDRKLHGGWSDVNIRPRYMVWENVPGAFSSNKGGDFQAVLTEIVKIVCKGADDVPMPEKGKWAKAGIITGVGDSGVPFSIAYRVHDAQYWGVPQRRKRLAVLADFNGLTAGEIMFDPQYRRETESTKSNASERDTGDECEPEVSPVSEGLSRNIDQSREKGQKVAADSENSTRESDDGIIYI